MTQRILPKLFALLALLTLPACGFHSVYGGVSADGTPVADALRQVAIEPIPERSGQMLRNYLIDRFNNSGRPDNPAYHLAVKLRISEEDLGTLANATTALAAVHAAGDYTLTDSSGTTLVSGTTSSTAQYDKLASMYGTLAAHDGAIERTVREIGEQLSARIGLYFAEQGQTP